MTIRLCKCHGEPMGHNKRNWYCAVKNRQRRRRYDQSEYGRAQKRARNARYRASGKHRIKRVLYDARYNHSPKGRACLARYRATVNGKLVTAKINQKQRLRRLRLGARYYGTAPTPEHARAINQHIRERLAQFRAHQAEDLNAALTG